ncbi:conserved exported protein of unknown function [Nitrospira moscoviensis]|uniref:Uncharacterized protein n=2 Tax=Nitrospira moscoviensis TaxID=42253 RepID=A0A0K2GHJ6_NITMO|nr:conserved exported protein of unknown function [Nitrospira moscoviensis]
MADLHELTLRSIGRYARRMRVPVMLGSLSIVVLAALCASAAENPPNIPVEDYGFYDQVVTRKFLTSETRLVVLERMTVPHLFPNQDGPPTMALFRDQDFFGGSLPSDLIRDFVAVNQEPARLEARFRFGVRYRFVSGDTIEEPEVRGALPVQDRPARSIQALPVLDRLAFSCVGRTLRNDQALVYVENQRPDGTGAGFLVWFRRAGTDWSLYDTEVIWTVREQPEESPLLAP